MNYNPQKETRKIIDQTIKNQIDSYQFNATDSYNPSQEQQSPLTKQILERII